MNDAIKFADFGCLSSVGRFNELQYRSSDLSLGFFLSVCVCLLTDLIKLIY